MLLRSPKLFLNAIQKASLFSEIPEIHPIFNNTRKDHIISSYPFVKFLGVMYVLKGTSVVYCNTATATILFFAQLFFPNLEILQPLNVLYFGGKTTHQNKVSFMFCPVKTQGQLGSIYIYVYVAPRFDLNKLIICRSICSFSLFQWREWESFM